MSTPADYFEHMYAGAPDPWRLADRWYEQRKYALTVASLTRPRYRSAFEPGCSVGTLTALLAPRCDALLSVDRVPAAIDQARARVGPRPGVRLAVMAVPDEWPDGRFDLVVLSELGYYLDPAGLDRLVTAATAALEPGGELVTVHWRHRVAEHSLTGDEVARRVAAQPGLHRLAAHLEDDFVLEVWARVPPEPTSVAAREGLC